MGFYSLDAVLDVRGKLPENRETCRLLQVDDWTKDS